MAVLNTKTAAQDERPTRYSIQTSSKKLGAGCQPCLGAFAGQNPESLTSEQPASGELSIITMSPDDKVGTSTSMLASTKPAGRIMIRSAWESLPESAFSGPTLSDRMGEVLQLIVDNVRWYELPE